MKKSNKTKTEPMPEISQAETTTNDTRVPSYVVLRDGYRVSDKEYQTKDDPAAIQERGFWKKVEENHSWGAKVDIVLYEPKKHRVW